jgi:hypothetical protein
MSKWELMIIELMLGNEHIKLETQNTSEKMVEKRLLYGYNITKSKDQVFHA